jgi:hypothetical protein
MVRRTDRPLLQVRVSFETTRFSQQHLIEVYARLAPTPRRSVRLAREDAPSSTTSRTATGAGGRP